MGKLAMITLILGCVMSFMFFLITLFPAKAMELIKKYPRNKTAGVILTGIDLTWVVYLLLSVPLGRFEGLKTWLYLVAPVLFFLIIYMVDELLAVRAGGGLLLLLASPMLEAAQWHVSGFRYVIIVMAYLMVIKGMVLVLSPYLYRKWTARFFVNTSACRAWGSAGFVFSVFLISLAVTVFSVK